MGVTVRRWVDGDRVWFAVAGLDRILGGAAERAGYRAVDGEWRRVYPKDTAHLERAWENFARWVEPMLRQGAGIDPVPWREALRELCRRTVDGGVDWWLAGSGALAVRGVQVSPGDLDLVCSPRDAHRLGDVLADVLVEPVAPAWNEPEDWISDWWARAFCGARIEWVAGVRPGADEPEVTDFGAAAAARLESVRWEHWWIRVPPLAMQRAVSQRRGLTARVAAIDTFTGV